MKKSNLSVRVILILAFVLSIFLTGFQATQGAKEKEILYAQQVYHNPNQQQNRLIDADLNTQFQLKHNQTASIKPDNLEVRFLNVIEDSRCPSDVDCFWAGQITIVVNIVKNSQNLGNFQLTKVNTFKDLAIKNFDSYTINFLRAYPYPKSNQNIKTSDYVITLAISKVVENKYLG
jgi:hypothetical protein